MAGITNREILFIVKLRNDARQAVLALTSDLQQAATQATRTGTSVATVSNAMGNLKAQASAATAQVANLNSNNGSATSSTDRLATAQTGLSKAAKDATASLKAQSDLQARLASTQAAVAASLATGSGTNLNAGLSHVVGSGTLDAERAAEAAAAARQAAIEADTLDLTPFTMSSRKSNAYGASAALAGTAYGAKAAKGSSGATGAAGDAAGAADLTGDAAGISAISTGAEEAEGAVTSLTALIGAGLVTAGGKVSQVFEAAWSTVVVGAANANTALKNWVSGASGAATVAKDVAQTGEAAEEAAGGFRLSAVAVREFIVLIREAARGDFSRMAGSASILTQNLLASGAASVIGLAAFAALAAGVIAFTVAVAQGESESNKFNNQLSLQGNYAGLTAQSYDDMARSIATSTGTSIGSNKELIASLASMNELTSPQIKSLATDIDLFAQATGQTQQDVEKSWSAMAQDPAKFAESFSQTYSGVISPIQAQMIADTQRREGAEAALEQELAIIHQNIAANVQTQTGYIIKYWRDAENIVSGIWDAMKSWGTQADQSAGGVASGQVAKAQAALDKLKAQKASGNDMTISVDGAAVPTSVTDNLMDAKIAAAQKALDIAKQQAGQVQAQADATKQLGDLAKDVQSTTGGTLDDTSKLHDAQKAYTDEIARAVALSKNMSLSADQRAQAAKTAAQLTSQQPDQMKRLAQQYTPAAVKDDKKDQTDANKEARAEAAAARKAAEEQKQAIDQGASSIKSLTDAYNPYLKAQMDDQEAKDKVIALDKLQITNQAEFQAALAKSGLSLEQFNLLQLQVKNGINGKDVIALFTQYGQSVDDMTAKMAHVKDEDTISKLFAMQGTDAAGLIKILQSLGINTDNVGASLAKLKNDVDQNIDAAGEKSFLATYLPDFKNFNAAIDTSSQKAAAFFAQLAAAKATGGDAYKNFLAGAQLTSGQADQALANKAAGVTDTGTDTDAKAIQKLASTTGIQSTADKQSYTIQQQLSQLEQLRTQNVTQFDAALTKAGLTQEQYNKLVQDATIVSNQNNGVMGAAKAAALDYVNNMASSGETLKKTWSDAFSGMTDAIVSFVTTGKLSFTSLINSMIADLVRLMVQKEATSLLSSVFGLGGGGSTVLSSVFGGTGDVDSIVGAGTVIPVGHSGGLAGMSGAQGRVTSTSIFDGARRFHTGGRVGTDGAIRSGEVPVIAKKDEAILPTARMADGNFGVKAIIPSDLSGNGSAGGNYIHFAPQVSVSVDGGGSDPDAMGQAVSQKTVKAMEALVKRVMTDEMRSGGMLSTSKPIKSR